MNGLEKRFREKHSYPVDMNEYDDNAKYLLGWPGYRTAINKSGLGYIETRAEWAHMQGRMVYWIATGKFITHNPIYLLLMTLFGILVGVIPLVMLIAVSISDGFEILFYSSLAILPYIFFGIGLLVNVGISFLNPKAKSITGD